MAECVRSCGCRDEISLGPDNKILTVRTHTCNLHEQIDALRKTLSMVTEEYADLLNSDYSTRKEKDPAGNTATIVISRALLNRTKHREG